jgi:hypothetical protein
MVVNFQRFLMLASGASLLTLSNVNGFSPSKSFSQPTTKLHETVSSSSVVIKPTGTSFLPKETIEMAEKGSPVEKVKLAKDGTAAFIDVYEYARKIREGEMTWDEVEKADLESVSANPVGVLHCLLQSRSLLLHLTSFYMTALKMGWYAPPWQENTRKVHDAPKGPQRHCQRRPDALLRRLRRKVRRRARCH